MISTGCKLEEEFDCQDERCIKKELECNGIENCRFRWDDDEHCQVSRLPVQHFRTGNASVWIANTVNEIGEVGGRNEWESITQNCR